MIRRSFPAFITALFLALTSTSAAADWRYAIGAHDFIVPEVESHTYGINGSVLLDKLTDSKRHLFGSFDLFLDHDTDHLDPDHIPVWGQLHLGSDADFWRDNQMHLGWTADMKIRVNTASSVERQITALPALVGGYDAARIQASVEAGAGWFCLELDDDAPRQLGYGRDGLRNSTFAYEVAAKLKLKLGESWAISGQAGSWWDGDATLENQYQAALRIDASHWMAGSAMKHPELVFSADYYQYNLDFYTIPPHHPSCCGMTI